MMPFGYLYADPSEIRIHVRPKFPAYSGPAMAHTLAGETTSGFVKTTGGTELSL